MRPIRWEMVGVERNPAKPLFSPFSVIIFCYLFTFFLSCVLITLFYDLSLQITPSKLYYLKQKYIPLNLLSSYQQYIHFQFSYSYPYYINEAPIAPRGGERTSRTLES